MKIRKNLVSQLRLLLALGCFLFPALSVGQDKTAIKKKGSVQDNSAVKEKLTLEDIFKVWREREKKFRTLRIKWSITEFVPKSFLEMGSGKSQDDLTLEAVAEYVLSGSSARCERVGMKWDQTKYAVVNKRIISTYDSQACYDLFENIEGEDHHNGFKFASDLSASNVPSSDYWPILRLYRIADPQLGILHRGTWKLERGKTIDGRYCVLVVNRWVYPGTTVTVRDYFFVDTKRDMVPVEIGRTIRENTDEKLRIQYEKDDEGNWKPASWHFDYYQHFKNRVLASSQDIVVTYFESNQTISDSEFRIVFPAKTVVNDETVEEKNRMYLVMADGTHRVLTESERRDSQTFTDTLRQIAMEESDGISLFWWVLLLVFSACVTWWLIHRYRQRGSIM